MKNLRDSKSYKPLFRRQSTWKQPKTLIPLILGAGLLAFAAGALLPKTKFVTFLMQWKGLGKPLVASNQTQNNNPQQVLPLLSQPAALRASQLEAIASAPPSVDRNRARFVLADDLIQQKQGKKALTLLEGLEEDYPVLAAHIILKRARAYELIGDKAKARDSWQDLLDRYPKEPAAAEALHALSKSNPKLVEQAIAEFPSHPHTLEVIRRRLEQNPKQTKLMLLLAKHGFDTPGIVPVLDRLVQQSAFSLKPADWEIIASAYWESQQYEKASIAYNKAPQTPRNAYRVARGLELAGKTQRAKVAYERVANEFPTAKESGTSLLRVANLSRLEDAVPYLDRVVSKYPDFAGEALITEAKVLDRLNSTKAAEETRQLLVSKYGSSEAAAEYRWNMAQKRAAAKDFQEAWKWAQPITTESPDSKFAPRAAFWVGKWAKRLGRDQEAKAAFEHAIARYPQSYYAWRSAVFLGLPVGDFNSVRQLKPQVVKPAERPQLAAGSPALKELYQLYLDRDAWTLWQAESQNRMQPTVAEQFTEGLLRLGRGENLKAISLVSTLEDRETPTEQAEYKALKQQPAYWQALYPFPYVKAIESWSQQRKLNPLLVTSLVRQESRFMPNIRSSAGAVGLMQVMPATGKWAAQNMKVKEYKLENPNDNIKLGTWFLDVTHQQYKNNSMLAVASYNAGPGNVSKWLKEKGAVESDEFVETIPFEETRGYVKNVFGNYWNYSRLYNPQFARAIAKHSIATHSTVINSR